MKLYVINLDRSSDRLAHLSGAFAAHALQFTRVAAIDGDTLSASLLGRFTGKPFFGGALTANEIGCYLSHRKCYKLIAEGSDEYAAIFEDDIVLSENCRTFLETSHWIPPGVDIVKLDTYEMRCILGRPVVPLSFGYSLAPLLSTHFGGAGYIISRKCATKLYAELVPADGPIDVLLFDYYFGALPSVRVEQLNPAIVKQAKFDSTIRVAGYRSTKVKRSLGRKIAMELGRFYKKRLRPWAMILFKRCYFGVVEFR